MDDPAYLRTLETGNVGVLLGEPSAGLCAFDFDADGGEQPFVAVNPMLASSFRTQGA